MSQTQQNLNVRRVRPIYQQIIQGVTLPLVAMFILAGVISVVVLQIRITNDLYAEREETSRYVSGVLATEFDEFLSEVSAIANGRPIRQYALTVTSRRPGEMTDAVRGSQAELLQVFDDLIEDNADRVLAMRYLEDEGGLWGAALNTDGIIDLDTTYTADYAPKHPATYVAALNTAPETQFLLSPLDTTNADISTIVMYVPVRSLTQAQVIGMLEVEVATLPFLADFNATLSESVFSQVDGRLFALFDSADQPLYADPSLNPDVVQALLVATSGDFTDQLQGVDLMSVVSVGDYQGGGFPLQIAMVDNFFSPLIRDYANVLLVIVIDVALCVLALTVLGRVLRRQLLPVEEARMMVAQLSGDLQARTQTQTLNLAQSAPAPLEDLVSSVENATSQIQKLRERLERESQRRRRDIEIAARIGREAATLFDLDQIFDHTIELVCRELGFYHAQVFLTDEVNVNAVLVRSRGEAGAQLLAQQHKIVVGSKTLIGQVSQRGEAIIVNDTWSREGAPHAFNAILSDTRAELGLPLVIGSVVIGVLDIQSRVPHSFNPEDLPTFQLLADQLALAVNTARLLSESRQQMRQVEALNRRYTRQSWDNATEEQVLGNRAYRYNLSDVEATLNNEPVADHGNGGMALPINLRGEVIGMLSAAASEGQLFTEGDEVVLRAVADRVALAVENARLFQETQGSLAETSILYQLTRYLNEATTLDDILQALIVSVMNEADGGQIWTFDDYPNHLMPEGMMIAADLAIAEREAGSEHLVGLRLQVADHPFLQRMRANQVLLVNDAYTDNRLDEGLQALFGQLNARAIVLIPLNVRGEWHGMLMVEYDAPREFSERDGRIFSALIDQAGVAIDNRLLLEQSESERTRSENLYAASRIINTMQNFKDLVYAVVATNSDPELDFRLTLLEGDLDATGWPTVGRIVAESKGTEVHEADRTHMMFIPQHSSLRQRAPEIVRDEDVTDMQAPTPVLWLRQEGYRSAVYLPLFSANQPIAIFAVFSHQLRDLTTQDYEVYRAITGQMSTQLENRRLLGRAETAADESRRLYLASRAISSAQDSRAVYYAATDHLARPYMPGGTLQSEIQPQNIAIAILLNKPAARWDAPFLECVYDWASAPQGDRIFQEGAVLEAAQFPVGRLLLEATNAVYLKDTNVTIGFMGEAEANTLLRQNGGASAIIAPIQARQKLYGVIVCQSSQTDAFNVSYSRFVESIADQLALAVDNRQLFEEAQIEARRAQQEAQRAIALAEAAQLANQVGEDGNINFEEVFTSIALATGYDRWVLAVLDLNVLDEAQQRLLPMVVHLDAPSTQPILLTEAHPLAFAARKNRVLTVNRYSEYPDAATLDPVLLRQYEATFAKFVALPVRTGNQVTGALLVGRSAEFDDMNDGDAQLVATLASQVAVAQANRSLFRQVQSEQQTLRSILGTLPAGIVVLDPLTLRPVLTNEQADRFLRQPLAEKAAFNAENYNMYRTGTQLNYPNDELPVFAALRNGASAFTDDVAIIEPHYRIDLLVNAAPILDGEGNVSAIVATFSDISNLRSLENTLQENLRETVAVYEAQSALTEANGVDGVLDVLILQLAMMQPSDAYILLIDEFEGTLSVGRELVKPLVDANLFNSLLDETETVHASSDDLRRLPPAEVAALEAFGITSVMTVPLRARLRNVAIGWMVTVLESGSFSLEQERIVTQLGGIASTAIDNRYLMQSTRAALQETASLYSANNAISRSRDLEQLTEALRIAFASIQPTAFTASVYQQTLAASTLVVSDDGDLSLVRAALLRHVLPEEGVFIGDLAAISAPDALERDLQIAAGDRFRAVGAVNLRVKDSAGGVLLMG
ncbi:MAG: GAF domain-containing protein, partial [Armatimonadetes bacterium]|nr:GAF domain-containing protein [Anaerolineae bacterium]